MPSSHQFKVQPVDMIKLKAIRVNRNKKKRARLYEEMGLPVPIENKSHQKKHFRIQTI